MQNSRKDLVAAILSLVFLTNPLLGLAETKEIDRTARGLWETDDCLEVSEHAGLTLYWSGELLKKADAERKIGNKEASDELNKGAIFFSQLSANSAKTFEVFCKR